MFRYVLYLSLSLCFIASVHAENLTIGKMVFGPDCYDLQFFEPQKNQNELKFEGVSAAGWAAMHIEVPEDEIFVDVTGSKFFVSAMNAINKGGYHKIYVYVGHEDGVCSFEFPLYGVVQKPDDKFEIENDVHMKINEARQMMSVCEDIGFVPNTEKFGNCVLELINN